MAIWTASVLLAVGIRIHRASPQCPGSSVSRAIRVTRMGFPIMLVGLLGSLYYTADRWIAAGSLTAADAGSYGLASLVASAAFLVPMVIAQQQYPRLANLYGKGVGSVVLIALRNGKA